MICDFDEIVVLKNMSVVDVNDVAVVAADVNTSTFINTSAHAALYEMKNVTMRINNQTCKYYFYYFDSCPIYRFKFWAI